MSLLLSKLCYLEIVSVSNILQSINIMLLRRATTKFAPNFRHSCFCITPLSDIYIISAVRTPIGSPNGCFIQHTAPELGATAIKEALERAKVPFNEINQVFMGSSSLTKNTEKLAQVAGLPKTTVCTPVSSMCISGMRSVQLACEYLMSGKKGVCAAGGMESVSNISAGENDYQKFFPESNKSKNMKTLVHKKSVLKDQENYISEDLKNFSKAKESGAFEDEMAKIVFSRKGQQMTIAADEQIESSKLGKKKMFAENGNAQYSFALGDGAAVLVLGTKEYVQKNSLTPLAKIISIANNCTYCNVTPLTPALIIQKALAAAKCTSTEIRQWEINDFSSLALENMEYLKINRFLINKDGGVHSLGHPISATGARVVCHLAHSLPSDELGCAATCNTDGNAAAVIIKKLSANVSKMPKLTLYTKYPCPLCDKIKENLKSFKNRFTLEEIDIEAKENEKLFKLYRYEIPVLFLDDRFLCKGNLNCEQFKRRLSESEEACLKKKAEFDKGGEEVLEDSFKKLTPEKRQKIKRKSNVSSEKQ